MIALDRIFGCSISRILPTSPCYRIIELIYPDDTETFIYYEVEPLDPKELPELMWKLQHAASKVGFTIRVTSEDGTSVIADPL